DSRTPMWLAILSVCVTVPLAFLFIDVLRVGPIGAAYAVVTNSAVICALSLFLLWEGRADLTIRGGAWGLDAALIRSIFSISLPSAAESAMFSVGILALSGFAFRLGTESSAAHQIVNQVESFSFLPWIGFSGAASALVGQALGMGDPGRATRSVWAGFAADYFVRAALLAWRFNSGAWQRVRV